MGSYKFKMGVLLNETGLPFEQAAELAQELGAGYAEVAVKSDDLNDAHAARCRQVLDATGLQAHVVLLGPTPFKRIHIDQIELADLATNPEFVHDLDILRRGIAFAKIVGSPNVHVDGFAWPGEYQADGELVSPTWRQRYTTGGGEIPPAELDKLAKAFGIAADLAERQDIAIGTGMMPWNYTNTSGNFRRIMERVGSPRLKCKWGPADNYHSGELDTVTTGYQNLKPYLVSLHPKNVHVLDGPGLKFQYGPIESGDLDYAALFRTFARDQTDIVIAVSTHFLLPGDTKLNTLRVNYANTLKLTEQALAAVDQWSQIKRVR